MSGLTDLVKLILGIEGNCYHDSPSFIPIADFIDRQGKFSRAYFCKDCLTYTSRDDEEEKWAKEFISNLRENKFKVYISPENLSLYISHAVGKSGRRNA